jgi:site-specific DNA-methyltransferase (adenine-specific)
VRKIIVKVKGGDDVGPAMVRDLIADIAREKADIGLFITLTAPTPAMITEAAAAGFFASRHGTNYPRVQLLTIKGLLAGSQHAAHPDYEPDLNFKKRKLKPTMSSGS